MRRLTHLMVFLCLTLLLVIPKALGQTNALNSNDFRISIEEEKLIRDLRGAFTQPTADQRIIFQKLGLIPTPSIQKKWEKYLDEVHSSSTVVEQAIFIKVQKDYFQAINDYSAKLKSCSSRQITSSDWKNELNKQFGEKFIRDHNGDIGKIIFSLSIQRQWKCLEKERKNLLQAEWLYKSVQKSNLETIVRFYESDKLSESEKKQMEPRLKTSRIYFNLLNKVGMAKILFLMVELRTQEQIKKAPPKLVKFLSSHPTFSQPFKYNLDVIDNLN